MPKTIFTLFTTSIFLFSCGPSDIPEEPTEVTAEIQAQMDEYRAQFAELLALIPPEGEEVAIEPEGRIEKPGKNKFLKKNWVWTVEEKYLSSIASDGKENEALRKSGDAWLSTGNWNGLDEKPLKDHQMYTPWHAEIMSFVSDMSHLGVIRWKYYTSGKVEGDEIVKRSEVGIWFWLIDVKNKKIVACTEIDEQTGDMVYVFNSSGSAGSNDLASNIRTATIMTMNDRLNEWAGTKDQDYVRTSKY